MAIGSGWVDGAWVDGGWVVGAWAQASATKTIGGTSQLGAFTSSAGITVVVPKTIGATSQLEAFTSSAGITVVVPKTIGGTSQLGAFTSSGFLQAPDVASKGGAVSDTRRREKALREETERFQAEKKEELDKLFPQGTESIVEDLLTTGKATIGDTEISLPDARIKRPILVLPKAPIDLDKEIAKAFHKKEKKALQQKKTKHLAAVAKAKEDHVVAVAEFEVAKTSFEDKLVVFLMMAMSD